MKNIIEIKDIYHIYKEKEVLKGISLTVKKGEIIGLLGPSGVGKTTVKKYFHDLTFEICFHVSFCNKGLSSATQFPFHTPVWL